MFMGPSMQRLSLGEIPPLIRRTIISPDIALVDRPQQLLLAGEMRLYIPFERIADDPLCEGPRPPNAKY